MKTKGSILALALWAFSLGACVSATTPPPESAPVGAEAQPPPAGGDSAVSSPVTPPPAAGEGAPEEHRRACHLPAAKKSDDACKADADCGPSDPCHAKACVARAKSKPKTADTMCTMMLGCETADANRCGCFEGRCSLIPPADAANE